MRGYQMKLYLVTLCVLLLAIIVGASADYYTILDLPRDATKEQIKRHYKKLSRVHHPDKNPGDDSASNKFMEIANAYEVLMDDEKRSIYDRYGEEGLKQGGGNGGSQFHDPFDIFSHFFGGGHRGQAHAHERRGPNIIVPLKVTLEELYNGKMVEVDVSKQLLCDQCHGTGARRPDDYETCHVCQGRKVIVQRVQIAPGMVQQRSYECDKCDSNGKIITHKCPVCAGNKVHRGHEVYTVHIEPGMQDDQQVILDGEADEFPNILPGDIVFTVEAIPHPVFERVGNNLYTKQHINLVEALAGFHKTLKHLDDSIVDLQRESVTPYGYVQTIHGRGMPFTDDHTQFGDLFVEYQVIFPSEIDDETIDYLKRGTKYDHPIPKLVHQEL